MNVKFVFASACLLAVLGTAQAQNARVTWGEEFKLKKGTTDIEVVHADKTGIFVKESHKAMKSYFVFGRVLRESASLIKLDKSFEVEYTQNFNKELKGKEFEDLFFIKDKLFLLASDYNKKDKSLILYAAELDKPSGEVKGEWIEVTNWQKEEKSDDIQFNIDYNSDSSRMVLVSTIEGKGKNNYEVKEFDLKLRQVNKTVVISNEFDKSIFQLEDVIYTREGNIVLVARIYEYQEGKKKKSKFLQFVNYNIRIYNPSGTMVKELNSDVVGKWLVSAKVLQVPGNDLVLAAFYSNERRKMEVNGMLVQRINPNTGDVVTTSNKQLSTAMIDKIEDDENDEDDDESKQVRKERERLEKIQSEDDGFSRNMRFRDFIFTPDSGVIVMAEKFNNYVIRNVSYAPGTGMGGGRTMVVTYMDVYECGDLMMSKIDVSGNINWLHVLPKYQREQIDLGSTSSTTGFSMGAGYFRKYIFNRPFYGGFATLKGENHLTIVFNDHKKNGNVLQLGQKYRRTSVFGKSICFGLKLDMVTGKYTRTELFDNRDQPTAMPRLGSAIGKDLYIIGKEDRMFGKSKVAAAKISVK